MSIKDLITRETVLFSKAADKKTVLRQLASRAAALSLVPDRTAFEKAVINRENLGSTGIGLGVAIPHTALAGIDDFFIITGVTAQPVLWDAFDGEPVRLVFLTGIPGKPVDPEKNNSRYLGLIAELMRLIKDERLRQELLTATETEKILKIVNQEFSARKILPGNSP